MATGTQITTEPRTSSKAEFDQCVELDDIGWKGYSTLLWLRGERRRPRI